MFKRIIFLAVALLGITNVFAQQVDEDRMRRDIEVGEDILRTLIRQQFSAQRTYFPVNISGNYQAGFGVTFNLPADVTIPIAMTVGTDGSFSGLSTTSGSYRTSSDNQTVSYANPTNTYAAGSPDEIIERAIQNQDSIHDVYYNKVVDACRDFIFNYSEMISQLPASEKIVISNQAASRQWVGQYFNAPSMRHLTVEVQKSDISSFKAGKLSKDQFNSRIRVVNTRTVELVEPDIELLAGILYRIYSPDLSKTYYTEDNVYFERLKDFGVIYYMQVYSSTVSNTAYGRYNMPTLRIENLTQADRDAKVVEMLPTFEAEFKEYLIDYGRTIKSLPANEQLVVQIKLTRCTGCGIPATLEYAVKASVLNDLNAGKIDRAAALNKIVVKRGEKQ